MVRGASSQYTHACYSDIPHLYVVAASPTASPRTSTGIPGDMQYLEYPVLTGLFMQIASWLTPGSGPCSTGSRCTGWSTRAC